MASDDDQLNTNSTNKPGDYTAQDFEEPEANDLMDEDTPEDVLNAHHLFLGYISEVRTFREVLPNESIGVFIGTSFP